MPLPPCHVTSGHLAFAEVGGIMAVQVPGRPEHGKACAAFAAFCKDAGRAYERPNFVTGARRRIIPHDANVSRCSRFAVTPTGFVSVPVQGITVAEIGSAQPVPFFCICSEKVRGSPMQAWSGFISPAAIAPEMQRRLPPPAAAKAPRAASLQSRGTRPPIRQWRSVAACCCGVGDDFSASRTGCSTGDWIWAASLQTRDISVSRSRSSVQ